MINKNQDDNGSTKNSKGIFNESELIQENNGTIWDLASECSNSKKINNEIANDANTAKLAIQPDKLLLIFLPKNPFIKNPNKGNNGIRATNLIIYLVL